MLRKMQQTIKGCVMQIVLQNNLILVRTDFETLNQPWMIDFLNKTRKKVLLFYQNRVPESFRNGNTLKEENKRRFFQEKSSKAHYWPKRPRTFGIHNIFAPKALLKVWETFPVPK